MTNAKKLALSFVSAGCVGILIAIFLIYTAPTEFFSPTAMLILWPSSVAGMADPATRSDKTLVGLFEFGVQFLLYGTIGLVIGFVSLRKRALRVR